MAPARPRAISGKNTTVNRRTIVGASMTIIRTLAAAAMLFGVAAPAFAGGKPTAVGSGLGTAATTSGQSGSHVSATPGQAAPAPAPGFSLTPGQGTTTATSTPATTNNPNPTNIGHGTTK